MWTEFDDEDIKHILYVQTHGNATPERSATPFFLATAGAAMDNEVAIYFTMNGPQLLAKGAPETIVVPKAGGGGKELRYFIDQALDMGVRLLVCQPSLDLHGFTVVEGRHDRRRRDDRWRGLQRDGCGGGRGDLVLRRGR